MLVPKAVNETEAYLCLSLVTAPDRHLLLAERAFELVHEVAEYAGVLLAFEFRIDLVVTRRELRIRLLGRGLGRFGQLSVINC